MTMNTISISQELKKCIEQMSPEARRSFDFYCLGVRNPKLLTGNEYTLDFYIDLVSKCFAERSNFGRTFVVYKSLNKNNKPVDTRNIWKKDIIDYNNNLRKIIEAHAGTSYVLSSCFVTSGNKKYKYDITFENFENNTGVVFLIHPDIISINEEEIELFAAEWQRYYLENIAICPKLDFFFIFGNRKALYSGNVPPTHKTVKELKLNVSMLMPINSLVYEKE